MPFGLTPEVWNDYSGDYWLMLLWKHILPALVTVLQQCRFDNPLEHSS